MSWLSKDRIKEFIKYDYNEYKFPLVVMARFACFLLKLINKHDKAFSIASNVYRTGWPGSYDLGLDYAKFYFFEKPSMGKLLVDNYINAIEPLENTKKFFDDPLDMLDGVVTVLQAPANGNKGVLIIKYSYYFPLFIRLYNVKAVAENYHIILEPSWAGFCDLNLLSYLQFPFPVFVQAYEKRDKQFLEALNSNLIPLDVGPSWFINHENFNLPTENSVRDIDIIMVAAWARYKRHKEFFNAIKNLKAQMPELKIFLIGYPVDMTKSQVLDIAKQAGFEHNVTILEWITPEEVADHQRRAKVNVLWSKFEGNNRAIIEGMFSNTPVVLRRGHNYGEHYDFINEQTGCFADEANLSQTLLSMIQSQEKFEPRNYVMEHRNCIRAAKIMGDTIERVEHSRGNSGFKADLVVKVNELHGMKYLNQSADFFKDCYDELASHVSQNS
uniref:glycosyltransferase n=1 Tax=Ningiella ruwaisensis TaxID=2364274 RepID=UPI0010A0851A|nr:glycosyltransferase [Ningiella ruwaisensis]